MAANLISPEAVAEILNTFESTVGHVLIDVRGTRGPPSIPGFFHVPLDKLSKRHFRSILPGNTARVIITCGSGGKASRAFNKAVNELSIPADRIHLLEGGFNAWQTSGKPTVDAPQPFVHLFYEQGSGTCCFVVIDEMTSKCVVIDPVLNYEISSGKVSYEFADSLLEFLQENQLDVTHILESHVHADHITAAAYMKLKLPGNPPICIGEGIVRVQENVRKMLSLSEAETSPKFFDMLLKDNQTFPIGSLECKVISTGGHTPDSVSYCIGDSIFCGDSVFYPDVGSARCDFPEGSAATLYQSVQKLYRFPDGFKLFSGHDYPPDTRPEAMFTTIGQSKTANKQLNASTKLDEFISWRNGRDAGLNVPKLLYPSLIFNVKAGRPPLDGFVKVPLKFIAAFPKI